jgi:hypothetical protein
MTPAGGRWFDPAHRSGARRWLGPARWFGSGQRACMVHRATLLEVLDGRPRDRAVEQALEHLGRCEACRRDIAELALVVAGLRRLGAAARRTDAPSGGWGRVAQRLGETRSSTTPWLRTGRISLAALVAVPLVAALLVAPGLALGPAARLAGQTAATAGAALGVPAASASALQQGPLPVPGALHAAALERAFAISDGPVADDVPVSAAGGAVTPRGPLPDGLVLPTLGAPANEPAVPVPSTVAAE